MQVNIGDNMYKMKNGYYQKKITINKTRKSFYAKTEEELEKKISEYLGKTISVSEWTEIWLDNYTNQLKESTKRRYIVSIKNDILPNIGSMILRDVKQIDIQQLINTISERISAKSVRNTYFVISRLFNDAEINGYIIKNPLIDIKLPRKSKKPINYLNESTLPLFLKKIEQHTTKNDLLNFLVNTGLRISEALGLTWEQVNLVNYSMIIDRQLYNGSVTTPKYNKIRKVILNDKAIDILNRNISEYEYVFCNPDGKPLTYSQVFKYFKRICREIQLPTLRIHDLRHTFTVMSLKAGVDVKTLSTLLGHCSVKFTLDVYAHVTNDMFNSSRKALNLIN